MPIGTILPYVGSLDDIPNGWFLCDGNNGTPDLTKYFLQGTSTDAGVFVEAGLPNITGYLWASNSTQIAGGGNGAFYVDTYGSVGVPGGATGGTNTLRFDASRDNPIYGASDTVQPKAYTVYYIIKVK